MGVLMKKSPRLLQNLYMVNIGEIITVTRVQIIELVKGLRSGRAAR